MIVSDVAGVNKYYLLALLICFVMIGCAEPTKSDMEALQKLTEKYGDRYDFKFDGEFWLVARAKKNVVIRKGEDEEMYKVFVFENKEKMIERNTSYIYLDLYDSDGNFVCQLFFEQGKKAFGRGDKPYRS